MKRIKLLFSIASIVLLMSACKSKQNHTSVSTRECNRNDVNGLINDDTAKKLADNYANNMPEGDSRSAWFSYEEISNYLCLLKSEYDDSNDKNLKDLGIRIYFGRYPENICKETDFKDICQNNTLQNLSMPIERRVDYSGKHCLFFVPTYKVENSKMTYHQDYKEKETKTLGKLTEVVLLVGVNKNHGGLAPPSNVRGAEYLKNQ